MLLILALMAQTAAPADGQVTALRKQCEAIDERALGVDLRPLAERVIAACSGLTAIEPDNPATYKRLASAYIILQRYEHALESFEQAIRLQPDDFHGWFNAGLQHGLLGRPEQAFEHFRRATALRADYWLGYFQAGLALQELRRDSEALVWLQNARDFDPQEHSPWGFMAVSLARLGRHAEAVAYWNRANRLHPSGSFVGEAGQEALYGHSLGIAGPQPPATFPRREAGPVHTWLLVGSVAVGIVGIAVYVWHRRRTVQA